MILSKNKDKALRQKLLKLEVDKKQLKVLFIKLMNDATLKNDQKKIILKYFNSKLQKKSSKSKLMKRCLLTSKSRLMYKRFKVSRVKLKDMLDYGLIPGYNKAVW